MLASSADIFPRVVAGGDVVQITAGLTSTGAPGGATIALSSSNPALLAVPGSETIPFGGDTPQIPVTVGSVSRPTVVTVTASFGDRTATSTVQIDPARVPTSIGFSPKPVQGSSNASGGGPFSVLSIVSIQHNEFILRGPLTRAGTYTFVLGHSGGSPPKGGFVIPTSG